MADRFEIHDDELIDITGGKITYTWNGEHGTLGMNGRNPYILLDKNAFISVYNRMKDDYSDADIIKALRENGIIRKA